MIDIPRAWASSLRGRLMIGYLIVVAVLAGAWGWSLAGPLTEATIDQHRSTLKSVAQAGVLVLADADADPQTAVDRLVARTRLRMTVVAADGTVIADSEEDATSMENHADRPEIEAALAGRTGEDRRMSETQGTERVYVAVPASLGGQRVALRVSESIEHINTIAANSRRYGLGLLALALGITALIATRLAAAASAPVVRLSESARAMARGDLSSAVPVETGDLSVLSTALTDLRDQMRRRLADLEAEERNLREVLDGLTDAVFLLHGNEIRFANRAVNGLLPGRRGSWRGTDIAASGLPASAISAILDAAGEPHSAECGPDPGGRYLRVTMLPLNPSELSPRTLVVIADITERTTIDSIRRDFVANASHELKTPTAAIRLLAESSATAAQDGDSATAVEFARQIVGESERLGRLVGDLLDLSRLETAPTPGTVTDLRESIANAVLAHRSAAERRGLELVFDDAGTAGLDAYVLADPTDLAIALDNLLDNAITYTDSGGVTVSIATDASHIRVSVSDTGIGIPSEDIGRVFERFYRVDRARSRESGGTGLGLALVRHMAERSGGSVSVRSTPGEGSTFTLALPRSV